ncbi:MAG TPA: hypothetical protein VFA72_11200, partial [Burkholderiales bacterium]|nr:hypothetical protein [Burkholderiales bacterium]
MAGFSFSDLDDCALAYEAGTRGVLEEILDAEFDSPGVLLEACVTVLSWNAGDFSPRSGAPLVERFQRARNGRTSLSTLSKEADILFAPLRGVCSDDFSAFIFAIGIAAQNGMASVGTPDDAAKAVAGAIGELVDNIRGHSGRAETGVIAGARIPNGYEFVAADCGRGALAGYLENPEFADLRDEGDALKLAVLDHVSRHGRNSGGGAGFQTLLRVLSRLDASVRIRSGDQALLLNGTAAQRDCTLAQKAHLQG